MKAINKFLKYTLVGLIIGSFASCEEYQGAGYILVFPDDVTIAVKGSSLNITGYIDITDSPIYEKRAGSKSKLTSHSNNYDQTSLFGNVGSLRYIDMRASNGWNNWKKQFGLGVNYLLTLEDTFVKRKEPGTGEGKNVYNDLYTFITKDDLTGPPAYLHLVVDSIDDFSDGGATFRFQKIKKWEVEKILDNNGVDLTNDPDWKCYNDNIYTFAKTGQVQYEPGTDVCDSDQILKDKGLQQIFLTYSIETPDFVSFENPGKMILNFQVPEPAKEFVEDFSFEIIASDFNAVQFRITKTSGEQADLYLIPSS